MQWHHVGQVDVPAHDNVCPGSGPLPQGGFVSAQQVLNVFGARHGNGLVHHHDAKLRRLGVCQAPGHALDLKAGDLPMFVPPGPGGVDAHHQQVGRGVHGFKLGAERGRVLRIGVVQACPQVEQWYVVVAGNGQRRRAQAVHKRARRLELCRACPLGDVTREHDHVGPLPPGQRHQRLHDRRLFRAEVQV